MNEWFVAEAVKREWENVNYQFIDTLDKGDIQADVFEDTPETHNVQKADVVYAPDCSGLWYQYQKSYWKKTYMEKNISSLLKWVKIGGWLYVSKILHEEGKKHLIDLGFEKVTNELYDSEHPMWRIKRSAPLTF
jgi:hypothetical protein